MSIELWAARLERPLTEAEEAAMLALLPPERRERLLRLRQPEKRREPLCAYLMLRRLSFGPETTRADIDQCAAALRRHHDTRMPML